MKTTPSIDAARLYLGGCPVFPFNKNTHWKLLARKERLWLGEETSAIVHICRPTALLHFIQGKPPTRTPYVGLVVDGSFWHTSKICYKCQGCGKVFDGGVAFILKVGLKDKDKFE
jgi:hypothetical protein